VIGMPGTSPGMTRSLFERDDQKTSRAKNAPRERDDSSAPVKTGEGDHP
jgi:hypothetical protein